MGKADDIFSRRRQAHFPPGCLYPKVNYKKTGGDLSIATCISEDSNAR